MAIKILAQQPLPDNTFMLQLGGLSSDTKPTDAFVATGSQFFEDDTDAVFSFNGSTWDLDKNGQMKDLPVVTSTDNGKILKVDNGVWSIGIDSGSSLPSLTGKNGKVLGVTLDAQEHEQIEWVTPSGGGAEKFVVTLTQDEQTEEWTADKTIAEIFTAYGAEKNVVVHAEQPIDIFCTGAFDMGNMKMVTFGCVTMDGTDPTTYAVLGYENQGTDGWMVNESRLPADGKSYVPAFSPTNNGQVLGVSSGSLAWVDTNAPLIVTLTVDQSTGNFVGDKTNEEVYDAFAAGQAVILSASVGSSAFKLVVQYASYDGTDYEFAFIDSTSVKNTVSGGANDYVTASLA